MNFPFFRKPAPTPIAPHPASEYVEDIIAVLKQEPAKDPVCFVDLASGQTLPATHWWKGGEEEDIYCFTQRSFAEAIWSPGILALASMADLWAFFVNPVRGTMIRPNGLRVDYQRNVENFVRYPSSEIHRIGLAGLARGFKSGGRLRGGEAMKIDVPRCMVCHKPVEAGVLFHCVSCDYVGQVHDTCTGRGGSFENAPITFGGSALVCPKCGARSR